MKLFIETCLPDLFVGILDENSQFLDYAHHKKMQKKSDNLAEIVTGLLDKNKINIKDIKQIYVTEGPGSFMGVRAGLIYAMTLAQVLKIELLTSNTLRFISHGSKEHIYLDAKSNESYYYTYPNKNVKLVPFQEDTPMDYKAFISKPEKYLKMFVVRDAKEIKPLYVKEPKIG